jgi:hypothetical protein
MLVLSYYVDEFERRELTQECFARYRRILGGDAVALERRNLQLIRPHCLRLRPTRNHPRRGSPVSAHGELIAYSSFPLPERTPRNLRSSSDSYSLVPARLSKQRVPAGDATCQPVRTVPGVAGLRINHPRSRIKQSTMRSCANLFRICGMTAVTA